MCMEDDENLDRRAAPMSDLFGNRLANLAPKKKSKVSSERAALIEYFLTNANEVRMKGRAEYRAPFIGMKLSHLSLQDLYAFKSMCEDRKSRGQSWGKYFWGSLKLKPNYPQSRY